MSRPLGPGPGAYGLPTTVGYDKHDPRKNRRPQYSFGVRSYVDQKPLGRGPASYNPDKLNRYGKSGVPAYSLGVRTKIPGKEIGPGPAGYNLAEYKQNKAPAYTLAGRNTIPEKSKAPGPNTYLYSVSPVKPGIAAYSMGLKTELKAKMKSPGPAAYGGGDLNTIRKRNPNYSMGMRTTIIDKRVSPGPNIYNLSGYKPGDGAPANSFGLRPSVYASPMTLACGNYK